MPKEKIKVSIIVPVYNVEKYIKECVDSLISQTYKNIEIILIDDGSTDSSGSICDWYTGIDERIKVINKKNGGLSDARNAGIKAASGEYITCVDSDDTVDVRYIDRLVELIDDADIGIVGFESFTDFEKIEKSDLMFSSCMIFSETEICKNILYSKYKNITHSAWGKIIPKDYYDDVQFPKGMNYEDYATTYKLLLKAKRVCVSSEPLYFYRTRDNSIINSKFNERNFDLLTVSDETTKNLVRCSMKLKYAAYRMQVNTYCSVLYNFAYSSLFKEKKYDKMHKKMLNLIKSRGLFVIINPKSTLKDKLKIFTLFISENIFLRLYNNGKRINYG